MESLGEILEAAIDLGPDGLGRFAGGLDPKWIEEALAATGSASCRKRKLPAGEMVWLVLGMAMLADRSICDVVDHLQLVVPGVKCPQQASAEEVARATLACLRRNVPAAVPGIFFLSGGMSDEAATANLNAMNAVAQKQPWVLSFSYGRALQAAALDAWRGATAKKAAAQQALLKRARLNGAAREGKYTPTMESA